MNTAEKRRDEIFALVQNDEIKNMMQAVLLASVGSTRTDVTESQGYDGSITFVYADESMLLLDTSGYCYEMNDNEISKLGII